MLSRPESLPPAAAPSAGGQDGSSGGAHDTHVGFWRNPKRFNVAVTRAKALLVVVGHPVVLMEVRAKPPKPYLTLRSHTLAPYVANPRRSGSPRVLSPYMVLCSKSSCENGTNTMHGHPFWQRAPFA